MCCCLLVGAQRQARVGLDGGLRPHQTAPTNSPGILELYLWCTIENAGPGYEARPTGLFRRYTHERGPNHRGAHHRGPHHRPWLQAPRHGSPSPPPTTHNRHPSADQPVHLARARRQCPVAVPAALGLLCFAKKPVATDMGDLCGAMERLGHRVVGAGAAEGRNNQHLRAVDCRCQPGATAAAAFAGAPGRRHQRMVNYQCHPTARAKACSTTSTACSYSDAADPSCCWALVGGRGGRPVTKRAAPAATADLPPKETRSRAPSPATPRSLLPPTAVQPGAATKALLWASVRLANLYCVSLRPDKPRTDPVLVIAPARTWSLDPTWPLFLRTWGRPVVHIDTLAIRVYQKNRCDVWWHTTEGEAVEARLHTYLSQAGVVLVSPQMLFHQAPLRRHGLYPKTGVDAMLSAHGATGVKLRIRRFLLQRTWALTLVLHTLWPLAAEVHARQLSRQPTSSAAASASAAAAVPPATRKGWVDEAWRRLRRQRQWLQHTRSALGVVYIVTPAAAAALGAWQPTDSRQRALQDAALDRGALACAAQQLGVAEALVELAVSYACERRQFGAPIGSFQAVKHQLADVKVALEYARSTVYRAAHSVAREGRCRALDVSMAKVAAGEAALSAARTALQVHGAIGYTWEQDVHIWMRRAWSLDLDWGAGAWHRARVADAVIDGTHPAESFGYSAPA